MVVCINRNVTLQLEVLVCEKDGAKEKSYSRYCLYTDFLERVRERERVCMMVFFLLLKAAHLNVPRTLKKLTWKDTRNGALAV